MADGTVVQVAVGNQREVSMWPDKDEKMTFAEKEMVRGFMDGYDLSSPRPSSNRSLSYRWGFMNALRDINKAPRFASSERARRLAEYVIRRDNRSSARR